METDNADKEILTYWLCPAEPAREKLSAIIGDLATRFDAPVFEPHVTLFSTKTDSEKPDKVLTAVMNHRQKYQLAIGGLDYSGEFTKTLFVQFAPDPDLTRLREDLERASASPSAYELNPHLSLLYKHVDGETKRRLALSIALPFSVVNFDSVKAVIVPATINSRKDVEAWRVVAEQRISG